MGGLPGVDDLVAERERVVETVAALTDDQFDHGETLCEGWAPRDVLAHLIGVDTGVLEYVKARGRVGAANAAIVEHARSQRRDRLQRRAEHWAANPAPHARVGALFLLGDVAVHHQDILRPLGLVRDLPPAVRDALWREGLVLGGRRLVSHRVEATDTGRALGRSAGPGHTVRGTTEAVSLWLCGRRGLDDELERI